MIFAANEYVHDISVAFGKIKEVIAHAQEKHKRATNKHKRSLAFKANDWVLLRSTKARLHHTIGKNKQGEPMGHIHNAFHVSLLKPYKGEPPNETTS